MSGTSRAQVGWKRETSLIPAWAEAVSLASRAVIGPGSTNDHTIAHHGWSHSPSLAPVYGYPNPPTALDEFKSCLSRWDDGDPEGLSE